MTALPLLETQTKKEMKSINAISIACLLRPICEICFENFIHGLR